jgi:predicted nucleic acid-binding protein
MTKKLFIDSDIILDLLAERPLFYDDAAKIFNWSYKKKIELYTTAVVLANVFYILRKVNGNDKSKEQIRDLRLLVRILPIDEHIVDIALSSNKLSHPGTQGSQSPLWGNPEAPDTARPACNQGPQ